MTIGVKIVSGYVLVVFLLVISTAVAFYALNTTENTYNNFIDVREKLVEKADEIRFEVRDQIAHFRGFILYPEEQEKYWNDLQGDHRRFNESVESMKMLVVGDQELAMLREIGDLQTEHERAQERVIQFFRQGKKTEALAIGVKEVRPLTEKIIEKTDEFRERQTSTLNSERADLTNTQNRLSILMGSVAIVAILSSVLLGSYLSRSLSRQIRESITRLSSSASEILAMTTQVASGASETATAVAETTTTVEEVKQTAQLSSQKAKYVSESSQKAAQVSQSGKKAVEESVEGMNRIRQQMESIAESIVRFSEQSQAIGDIIATVNDLAEQSNLLAVNAAIEAAKAGEQGKGFGVVAQEVKSLAEQSKQATAQVRTILNDIQRATSTAVMATEQGSKAVDAGVKQSASAGESIRTLAESVTESAQAATQIAASSQQQLVGMDQVALAMESIKQASTQNVASTKQAETAAKNLHELGQKLKYMVERDKVQ